MLRAMPDYLRRAPLPPPDYTREIPDGLERHSMRYLEYLPGIYHSDFTSRFIGEIRTGIHHVRQPTLCIATF